MSRRREIPKRRIHADPRYNDRTVAKFVNVLMYNGEKSISEHLVYKAFDVVGEKGGEEPLKTFKKALDNVKPLLEVKARRVGGATYQVPMEVRPERRVSLAMRWMITASRARSERSMINRLAAEILDASQNRGGAIKKREDTHKMAEANKAFAHYRW